MNFFFFFCKMFQYWSLSEVLLLSTPRGNGEVVMHRTVPGRRTPEDDMGVLSSKDTESQQVRLLKRVALSALTHLPVGPCLISHKCTRRD